MVEWRGRQITKDSQIVTSHVNVRWCEMTLCLSNQLNLNWDFRLKLRRGRSWSAISICWPGHESKSLSRVKNREKHISWSRLPMTPTTNNPKPSPKKNRTHLLQTHLNPNALDHLRPYRPLCTFHLGHLEWLGWLRSGCESAVTVVFTSLKGKKQLKSQNVRKIVIAAFMGHPRHQSQVLMGHPTMWPVSSMTSTGCTWTAWI